MASKTKAHKDTLATLPADPRYAAEYERLYKVFKGLPPATLEVARKVISRAAFATVKLEDLEREIATNGVSGEYKNGENQFGTKKSPEAEAYVSFSKIHSTVMKQLIDLLPKEDREAAADDFDSFARSR